MVGKKYCASAKVGARRINQILVVYSILESAGISSRVSYERYGYKKTNEQAIISKLAIVYRRTYDATA